MDLSILGPFIMASNDPESFMWAINFEAKKLLNIETGADFWEKVRATSKYILGVFAERKRRVRQGDTTIESLDDLFPDAEEVAAVSHLPEEEAAIVLLRAKLIFLVTARKLEINVIQSN